MLEMNEEDIRVKKLKEEAKKRMQKIQEEEVDIVYFKKKFNEKYNNFNMRMKRQTEPPEQFDNKRNKNTDYLEDMFSYMRI